MITIKTWVHNITKQEYSAESYSNHGGLGQDSLKYKDLPYDGYPYLLKEYIIEGRILPETFIYLKQIYYYDEDYRHKNNNEIKNKLNEIINLINR